VSSVDHEFLLWVPRRSYSLDYCPNPEDIALYPCMVRVES